VSGGEQVLYLFDEAEYLFRTADRDREPDPKIFIHRLLETAKVPHCPRRRAGPNCGSGKPPLSGPSHM
jgi:hypothetical protein